MTGAISVCLIADVCKRCSTLSGVKICEHRFCQRSVDRRLLIVVNVYAVLVPGTVVVTFIRPLQLHLGR